MEPIATTGDRDAGASVENSARLTSPPYYVDHNTREKIPLSNVRKHPTFRGFVAADRRIDGKSLTIEDNRIVF